MMTMPWDPVDMWYPRGNHTSRRELWIDPKRMGDYASSYPDYTFVPCGRGNCWSSKTTAVSDDMHLPILDVDSVDYGTPDYEAVRRTFDRAFGGVPQVWVPSTNNWHVYIGAGPGQMFDRAIPWKTLDIVLEWLADRDIVDRGWVYFSHKEEQCIVRKPGNEKRSKAWTCMWCAEELLTEQELEAHEELCG